MATPSARTRGKVCPRASPRTARAATRARRHAVAHCRLHQLDDRCGFARGPECVVPVLRSAVDELLDQEHEHAKRELTESMRSLEVQVARVSSHCPALQTALNIERTRTIDLPNMLRSVNQARFCDHF